MKILTLIFGLSFCIKINSQLLLPKLCTADARSSLVLQHVDKDWNPIPFDCKNTKVQIVGKNLKGEIIEKEIKPGQYHWCPQGIYKNSDFEDRKTNSVTVLFENPGNYDVTVTRLNQVNLFKDVTIEVGDDGCHTKLVKLEVMFEDFNKAKK